MPDPTARSTARRVTRGGVIGACLIALAGVAAAEDDGFARPAPAAMQHDAEWTTPSAAARESEGTRLSAEQIHQQLQDQLVAGVRRPKIDLSIQFEWGSADLTAEGRRDLDEAGDTLTRFFPETRFRLAGHTDASGGEGYNMQLSRDRAQAAKQYLVDAHDIPPARLEAVGYGETRPIPGASDAKNRRVALEMLR